MTQDQRAILDTFFSDNCYCRDGLYDRNLYFYMRSPAHITDVGELERQDKNLARRIAEFEDVVARLKVVRLAYAERYSELYSMQSYPVVRLKRQKRYGGNVYYYLSTFRRYENGQETEHDTKTFTGSERAAAIQHYKTYVKNHPGIIAEMDIQKGAREK